MKLYIATGSTSCRKVLATAQYLDIPLQLETIAFYAKEFDKDAFAHKNINGMVPLLEDGDFSLWESTAIMQYLADKKPDSALFSQQPQQRADISRWLYWSLAHFGAACDQLNWENVLKIRLEGGLPDQDKVADAIEKFHRFAAVLDQHLHKRDFIVTEHITLADFAVAAPLGYAQAAQLPWNDYYEIQRWYAQLETLAAWRDTAPQH